MSVVVFGMISCSRTGTVQRHHLHEDGDPRFKIHATTCDAIMTTTLKRSLMSMKQTFYLSEWSGWILRSMLHWFTSSFEHQCPPKMQQHPPSAMLAQAYWMAINTLVKIGQAISDALYHARPQKVILCFGFEKVWLKMHNFKSSQPKVEEIGFTGIVVISNFTVMLIMSNQPWQGCTIIYILCVNNKTHVASGMTYRCSCP